MYKKSKRFLAGFLAFLLVVTMLPTELLVYAAEEDETDVVATVEAEVPESVEAADEDDSVAKTETVDETVAEPAKADEDEAVVETTEIAEDEAVAETTKADEALNEDNKEDDNALVDSETEGNSNGAKETIDPDTEEKEVKEADEVLSVDFSNDENGCVLDISNLTNADPTTGILTTTAGDASIFTVTGNMKVNNNNKTVDGIKYTKRLQTAGTGSIENLNISFKATKPGTLTVIAVSGSSGKIRNLILTDGSKDADDNIIATSTFATNDTATKYVSNYFEKDKTYYLYSADSGINIYYLAVAYVDPIQISGTVTLSMGSAWDANDSTSWKAEYTGSEIKPTVTVGELTPSEYTVTYARGTGENGTTPPSETDYVSDTNFDFTSAGTIFVKVSGKGRYEGSLNPVSYTIEKKDLSDDQKTTTYPIDTASAPSDGTEWEHEIDLNTLFGFDENSGVQYTSASLTNDTDQNVLANNTVSINGTNLKFTSKTSAESDLKDAVIEVGASFKNYKDTTLTVTITMVAKTVLTIGGTPIANKEWDNEPITYDTTKTVLSGAENIPENIKTTLVVSFSKKDGTVLDEAPSEIGEYILTVSIPDTDTKFSGTQEFPFEITKKTLTLKAADRMYIKGYKNNPISTTENSDLYFNYGELAKTVVDTSLADLLKSVDVKLTYKLDENEISVSDLSTIDAGSQITIIPEMIIKTSEDGSTPDGVNADALNNYDIQVTNGTLTVYAEEPALDPNVYELNLTKDWTAKGGKWIFDETTEATTDGYFNVTADVKTAGTGNAKPMLVYDKYTKVAKMGNNKSVTFTPKKAGAKVEVIMAIQVGKTVKVGAATISVTGNEESGYTASGTESATATILEGRTIYPTNSDPVHKMVKAELTLTGTSECKIEKGSDEFQLHYVKVTELAGGSGDETTVKVTPTITGADKLNGAKVYFTAGSEEKEITTGQEMDLTKDTQYTLVVKNGTTVSDTLEAKIDNSSTFTPQAAGSVTITITEKGGSQNPGGDTDYNITVASTVSNATITVGTKTTAKAGDTVKLSDVATVTPAEGYKLSGWEVKQVTTSVTVTNDPTDGYVFTMPAGAVTVTPVITADGGEPNPPVDEKPTKPTADKDSGSSLASGEKITLLADDDAIIYYLKSNTQITGTPNATSTRYSGPIEITEETYIKAVAVKGDKASDVLELHYTVRAANESATPKATPKAGKVEKGTKVTLTAEAGAKIYYTTDQNDPTEKSTEYAAPIEINEAMTIKAIAVETGKIPSQVMTFEYTIKSTQNPPVSDNKTGIEIVGLASSYPYTGAAITPDFKVVDNDIKESGIARELSLGIDYTVKYSNNKNEKATATVTVVGKGNYVGKTVTGKFKIEAVKAITDETVLLDLKGAKIDKIAPQNYTGKPITPSIKLTQKGKSPVTYTYDAQKGYVKEDGTADINVAVSNNINKGTATIYVTGKKVNSKVTSVKATFKINPLDISKAVVSPIDDATYAVAGAMPSVTVKDAAGESLVNGRDYTVKYSANKKAGVKGKVTITGKGNYTNKIVKEFNVKTLDMANTRLVAATAVTGLKAGKVKATVVDANGDMLKASQYTVKVYKDNKGESAYTATEALPAAGTSIWVKAEAKDANLVSKTGTELVEFKVGADISKAKIKLNIKSKEYTGVGVTLKDTDDTDGKADLAISIKNGKKEVKLKIKPQDPSKVNPDETYDCEIISYSNNINKGTAIAVIQGIGDYSGTKTIKFKIAAKEMKKTASTN